MARPRRIFAGELSPSEKKRADALARNRAWYGRNREREQARALGRHRADPERTRQSYANWAENNREHLAEKDRLRYARDPVGELARAQKYRAHLAAAPGSGVSKDQWLGRLDEFSGICAYCLESAGATMDHVVPISRGGAHDLANIVPACASCNASKGNRSILEFAMRGGGSV